MIFHEKMLIEKNCISLIGDQRLLRGVLIKNPPANAGDAGDAGSVPGLEDPLVEEMATDSSILDSKITWTESGWLYSPWSHKE